VPPLVALLLLAAPPPSLHPTFRGSATLPAEVPLLPAELPTLSVRELTEAAANVVVPTPRALALASKRVRLIGFMVRQEEEQAGGFWLAARPVECDEGGGGTGDLPPGSVRVLMASDVPAPIDGPIAVTGVLEVGNDAAPDGPVSTFRLRLDRPAAPSPKS
jgi:hypothetical protein